MTLPRRVADVLSDHVTMQVECIGRMYLNLYVPKLAFADGIAHFFRAHRGQPFVSSALMDPITKSFLGAIHGFVAKEGVDLVHFQKGERKDDIAHGMARPRALATSRTRRVGSRISLVNDRRVRGHERVPSGLVRSRTPLVGCFWASPASPRTPEVAGISIQAERVADDRLGQLRGLGATQQKTQHSRLVRSHAVGWRLAAWCEHLL